MIVYLVGMPGSGKSTVGAELAGRLGVPFIDLDVEIERREGRSITEIFEAEGEAGFRALEAKELLDASTHDPAVIACGGGRGARAGEPHHPSQHRHVRVPRRAARRCSTTRVQPDAGRPLIRAAGDLERLLAEREPLYREFAAHVVDGAGDPGAVADAIVEELRWNA